MADGESESRHALAEIKPSRGKFVSSNLDAINRLPDGCSADNFVRCESGNAVGSFGPAGEFFASNNSVLHWAESFDALLEDLDGVSLFRLFLEQCDAAKCLEFLFACRGLKLTVSATDKSAIYRTVKAIYRKYLQNSGSGESVVNIDSRTKRTISERLYHKSTIDRNVLDGALEQVEQHLRHRWYPRFLQSKLYLQYVETHSQSVYEPMSLWSSCTPADNSPTSQQNPLPCIPSTNSGATTILTPLSKSFSTSSNPPLTRENLVISSSYRSQTPLTHPLLVTPAGISHEPKSGYNEAQAPCLQPSQQQQHSASGPAINPSTRESNTPNQQKLHPSRRRMTRSSSVHCYQKNSSKQLSYQSSRKWPQQSSFLPTSVQESELQSLSSEACTDDTYSYTDSSLVDSLRRLRSPGAVPPIRQTIFRLPRSTTADQGGSHVQDFSGTKESVKTEHNPNAPNPQGPVGGGGGGGGKERCLAEIDPTAFAKLLTERLLLVINRKSNVSSVFATTPGMVSASKVGDDTNNTSASPAYQQVQQRLPSIFCQPWAGKLLAAAAKSACAREDQQAAQTILEEHCSRVWHTPPQIYPCTSSSGGTGMANDGVSGVLQSSNDLIIPTNTLDTLLSGTGTMSDGLLHQHVHTTAEHRHIHHYHYPHHYVPLMSPGASKENERIPMSGGRLLSATQQQGSTFMGASDASSNIDSGVSLIYDTSSSAGPPTTAALISQSRPPANSSGNAKQHRGDTLLSHPSQPPMSVSSNLCQHQHLKPSKLLNTSGWMTDSFPSPPISKHISQNLYSDSTHPVSGNTGLQMDRSTPPIQTVSMGGAKSSCSNTNTASSKPYPAQQKVLAWMMESKELPPSTSSSVGVCYASGYTCSVSDASSFPMPRLTDCVPNTCRVADNTHSSDNFWNQKPFIRSPCHPSYLMYMGGNLSKSHSFPVEDTERLSSLATHNIPSVSTERPEISSQANILDQNICTLTKSSFGHHQSNSKSSPFAACPNTPSTSRMVHFQPDDSVNPVIHPSCPISTESKHLPSPSGNASSGLVVGYYLCDDPVPYRSHWPAPDITLAQFKQIVAKKGHFRYFFKTTSDEFETGVVHQEVVCDQSILPLWEGKVVAKIERVE